jgi:hypothetical protein
LLIAEHRADQDFNYLLEVMEVHFIQSLLPVWQSLSMQERRSDECKIRFHGMFRHLAGRQNYPARREKEFSIPKKRNSPTASPAGLLILGILLQQP